MMIIKDPLNVLPSLVYFFVIDETSIIWCYGKFSAERSVGEISANFSSAKHFKVKSASAAWNQFLNRWTFCQRDIFTSDNVRRHLLQVQSIIDRPLIFCFFCFCLRTFENGRCMSFEFFKTIADHANLTV